MNFLTFYIISIVAYWLLETLDKGHDEREDHNENMTVVIVIIMFIPFSNTLAVIVNLIVTIYDLLLDKIGKIKWGKIYDKMFFKRKYTDKVRSKK